MFHSNSIFITFLTCENLKSQSHKTKSGLFASELDTVSSIYSNNQFHECDPQEFSYLCDSFPLFTDIYQLINFFQSQERQDML